MTMSRVLYFALISLICIQLAIASSKELTLHTYIEQFGGVSLGFAKSKVGDAESQEKALQACRYAKKHDIEQRTLIADALRKDKSARHFQGLFSVAALLSGAVVALALYLSWGASYATQCVRNFRAIIEFRRRYEDCICTLESRISVQEIDFTYRRRTFVYPGDVAVPANMQANDAPIRCASRRRGTEGTSFPSVNADEEENLEGRTDFHAFERAAADVQLRALRRWKVNFMFVTGVISLVIQVIFCVGSLFVDMSDTGAVLVPLCKLELEAHQHGELDCRPHMNAPTIESLDMLMSWKRNFASEEAWSAGLFAFASIIAVIVSLGSFYHGGQQLIDNTPKKTVHLPREHFIAHVIGAITSWLALVFQLSTGYYFLSKFVRQSLLLEKCVADIYSSESK
uniref:Transmembrane protein n=1 Tax=Panagrellus redivivus TaxID=6233 RepID=A0A7E4VBX2_PANRE